MKRENILTTRVAGPIRVGCEYKYGFCFGYIGAFVVKELVAMTAGTIIFVREILLVQVLHVRFTLLFIINFA